MALGGKNWKRRLMGLSSEPIFLLGHHLLLVIFCAHTVRAVKEKREFTPARREKFMSLKKCKECGNEVSTKAKNCPKCGAPVKTNISCLGAIGIIILVFIVIGIIVSNQLVDNPQTKQNIPQIKQNNPQINPKKTVAAKINPIKKNGSSRNVA